MAKTLQASDFDSVVLKSPVPVLVDFFAEWCGPCKMLAPVIDELAAEYEGRASVVKMDIDNAKELAMSFGIRSIPTLIFFKDGKNIETIVGMASKPDLAAKLNKLI